MNATGPYCLRQWLGVDKQNANTWTNVDPDLDVAIWRQASTDAFWATLYEHLKSLLMQHALKHN